MKTGMILGIIGSLIALLMGAAAFFIGSKVGDVNEFVGGDVKAGAQIKLYIALLAPMLALIASYFAPKKKIAVAGMVLGAILFMAIGFSVFTLVLSGIIILGAVLIFLEHNKQIENAGR